MSRSLAVSSQRGSDYPVTGCIPDKRDTDVVATQSPATWPEARFDEDPRLLVGRRRSGHLEGRRVELHESTFQALAEICRPYVERLDELEPRSYEPYASLEPGEEYFAVEVADLPPQLSPALGADGQPIDETPDLVRLVRDVDGLELLHPGDLDHGPITFWGLCWETVDGDRIGFVRKQDPHRALGAKRYMGFAGGSLRTLSTPDLVLDESIDVIVSSGQVAAFTATAFTQLLSDVRVELASVTQNIDKIDKLLEGTIPLAPEATAVLGEVVRKRVSFARRLNALPDRLAGLSLTQSALSKVLKQLGIPKAELIRAGKIHLEDARSVELLLSVLEGRYFNDGLGGERRRADRWSTRI